MPSNYVTWPCYEVTSSHGSRSMAWYTLSMLCAFDHMSMVSFFTHGFASHKGFPPPITLKDSKFSSNYEPLSRRPSVYSQWTAQYITLAVPSNWQFHLANINKCWILPIFTPESLMHQRLMMMQETSFFVRLSNYGFCGTPFLTLYIYWRFYAPHYCSFAFYTGNSNPGRCQGRGIFRKISSALFSIRCQPTT